MYVFLLLWLSDFSAFLCDFYVDKNAFGLCDHYCVPRAIIMNVLITGKLSMFGLQSRLFNYKSYFILLMKINSRRLIKLKILNKNPSSPIINYSNPLEKIHSV